MKFIYLNNRYSWTELTNLNTSDQWLIDIQLFLINWFDDSLHIDVNTSGSTGAPKAIQLLKFNMRTSASITNNYFNLNKNKTAALCLPAKYIAGKMMIVRALEANMDIIMEEPSSSPLQLLDMPIDFIALTPLQVDNVLIDKPEKLNLINTIIIGGGVVSNLLLNKLQSINSFCYQTYGMTETITHIALQQINGINQSDYFKVLDGFEISADSRGCLCISAPHIHEQYVVTNDLVEIIDTRSFRWLGRYDNVINSGGVKLHPEIIESKIHSLIDNPFFITGFPDKRLGERVTLCIESDPEIQIDLADLLNQIKSRLSKFEIPRSILFFDCFMYTETGKIRRRATLESH